MAMGVAEAKLFQNAMSQGPAGSGGGSTPRQPPKGGKPTGPAQPVVKRLRPEQIKKFMS